MADSLDKSDDLDDAYEVVDHLVKSFAADPSPRASTGRGRGPEASREGTSQRAARGKRPAVETGGRKESKALKAIGGSKRPSKAVVVSLASSSEDDEVGDRTALVAFEPRLSKFDGALTDYRVPAGCGKALLDLRHVPAGSNLAFRGVVSFNQLVMMGTDVYRFLDLSELKSNKILKIKQELFTGDSSKVGFCVMDLSPEGLRKVMNFPCQEECTQAGRPCGDVLDRRVKLIIWQALRAVGKPSTTYCNYQIICMAMAHVDPQLPSLRPDWYRWASKEIINSLSHFKSDRQSISKFRDGWTAVVDIMKHSFLKTSGASMTSAGPLLIEQRTVAFDDIQAEWDAEKGKLVLQQETLKSQLKEANQKIAEAEAATEQLRADAESMKTEFAKEKLEWEARNQ
ncbi:hypothetical protein R1sor_025324 [Riccia sorocarpa]|uniref:Uncharacterized protein n=1 Tax=Riccia sorocarpa TaxID=122646 RepID=A0ABD3G9W6_9MARC